MHICTYISITKSLCYSCPADTNPILQINYTQLKKKSNMIRSLGDLPQCNGHSSDQSSPKTSLFISLCQITIENKPDVVGL